MSSRLSDRNVPSLVDVSGWAKSNCPRRKAKAAWEYFEHQCQYYWRIEGSHELVSQLRAKLFLWLVLASATGGCQNTTSGVRLELDQLIFMSGVLQLMGADVQIAHGIVQAHIDGSNRRLKGERFIWTTPALARQETWWWRPWREETATLETPRKSGSHGSGEFLEFDGC